MPEPIECPRVVFHEACDNRDFYEWMQAVTDAINALNDPHSAKVKELAALILKINRGQYPGGEK